MKRQKNKAVRSEVTIYGEWFRGIVNPMVSGVLWSCGARLSALYLIYRNKKERKGNKKIRKSTKIY